MKEMQFTAMVLMSLLTLTLAFLLPRRMAKDSAFGQSRWMMACGTALLAVQFLLQYVFGFREMGVTQAVMVNLLFFIPTSVLMSIAVVGLQRQGQLSWRDWMPGIAAYGVTVALLGGVILYTGEAFANTPPMRWAGRGASTAYLLMQLSYTYIIKKGNDRLDKALQNFYDRDMSDLLDWMRRAVNLLVLIALFAPLFIFSTGVWLLAYALLIFGSIYYMVFSFICYGVAGDAHHVQAAEANASETRMDTPESAAVFSDEDKQSMTNTVEQWLSTGGHLHSGITMQSVAQEMGVPRYKLSAWLKTTEQGLFNPWLTHLRIERAKLLLREHPEWSNDAVAESCGFSSRSYFQRVFRKEMGMTPMEYAEQRKI